MPALVFRARAEGPLLGAGRDFITARPDGEKLPLHDELVKAGASCRHLIQLVDAHRLEDVEELEAFKVLVMVIVLLGLNWVSFNFFITEYLEL